MKPRRMNVIVGGVDLGLVDVFSEDPRDDAALELTALACVGAMDRGVERTYQHLADVQPRSLMVARSIAQALWGKRDARAEDKLLIAWLQHGKHPLCREVQAMRARVRSTGPPS